MERRLWPLLHPEHLGVAMLVGRDGSSSTSRGGLAWSGAIFVAAFVEMDQLLVADKKVTDVNVSIKQRAWDVTSGRAVLV